VDSVEALPVDAKLRLVGGVGARPKRVAAQRERSQEDALAAVEAVCSYLDSDQDLADFFAGLSATIAQLTGASRAAFWRLGARGTLALQVAPYGFPKDSSVYTVRLQLGANGIGSVERLVFADELELLNGTSAALDQTWHDAGLADVTNSIAASWTAGGRRIGAVVAYDSPHGFSGHDLWVLRLVGMVAGLLWQYKESEDELGYTAVRLEEAVATRRHLLNNVAAGGDEARRRFASALHDDSLQLLTGAELQLERIRGDPATSSLAVQLEQLRNTLHKVEDSLRRLLTNVSPEPLQLPGDLNSAISERLESMRVGAGIEAHVDARVPSDLPPAIQAIAVKNIAEALTNVEKHAHATRVTIIAEGVDGGLGVQIADDGAGFVVSESARVPGHIGLVAMRERAQLAGGWCRIESEPGAGTRIQFWVPRSQ
jgi:signal transduction histidine kinase